MRLQAAEHAARASGLRALWLCTSGRERAAAGPGGGEAGSWGRTMALMTSWPRTAYSMSLIFGLICSGDSAAYALRRRAGSSQTF